MLSLLPLFTCPSTYLWLQHPSFSLPSIHPFVAHSAIPPHANPTIYPSHSPQPRILPSTPDCNTLPYLSPPVDLTIHSSIYSIHTLSTSWNQVPLQSVNLYRYEFGSASAFRDLIMCGEDSLLSVILADRRNKDLSQPERRLDLVTSFIWILKSIC